MVSHKVYVIDVDFLGEIECVSLEAYEELAAENFALKNQNEMLIDKINEILDLAADENDKENMQ